jgi:hypothetical protein
VVPFFVFASDGISYDRAYLKEMLVIGPGQREALLVQFSTTGDKADPTIELNRVMCSVCLCLSGR